MQPSLVGHSALFSTYSFLVYSFYPRPSEDSLIECYHSSLHHPPFPPPQPSINKTIPEHDTHAQAHTWEHPTYVEHVPEHQCTRDAAAAEGDTRLRRACSAALTLNSDKDPESFST